MAATVNQAFDEFNINCVNLDSDRTKVARDSRDWLIKQLISFPEKIEDFPDLYEDKHIRFGSFARNTKIRPLDDIDLIITFRADGTTYLKHQHDEYTLTVPESATNLRKLCNDDYTLNSIKVVNKIVKSLNQIEQYKQAEINRSKEAATLKLNSYEWNFDIVPAFYTDTGYYVIPNGEGKWKATDPRIDQKRVSEIIDKHGKRILQIIRTLKYWNRRAQMPTIPSYLFENFVLIYLESQISISDYIDGNLIKFWDYLKSAIYLSVKDPKGFQDELNNLTYDEKIKISSKAVETYNKGYEAYKIETEDKDQEKAIKKWTEIFGDDFPKYE